MKPTLGSFVGCRKLPPDVKVSTSGKSPVCPNSAAFCQPEPQWFAVEVAPKLYITVIASVAIVRLPGTACLTVLVFKKTSLAIYGMFQPGVLGVDTSLSIEGMHVRLQHQPPLHFLVLEAVQVMTEITEYHATSSLLHAPACRIASMVGRLALFTSSAHSGMQQ